MDSERKDTFALQLETVENREKYFYGIRKLLNKQLKYEMEILDNMNVTVQVPKASELKVTPITVSDDDVLNKKLYQDLVAQLKEQIRALEILNKSKNCPVSSLMDAL